MTRLLARVVLLLLGVVMMSACAMLPVHRTPLDQLQHAALSGSAWQAEYRPPTTAHLAAVLAKLESWATAHQVTILRPAATQVALAPPEGPTIAIPPTLGIDGQAEFLAHHLAHLLAPPWLDQRESEVFADAVALLVIGARPNEVRTYGQYFRRFRTSLGVLRVYRREIERVAQELSR